MGAYPYLDSWAYLPTYLPTYLPLVGHPPSQSVGAPRLGWWNATTFIHQGKKKKKAMIIVHSSSFLLALPTKALILCLDSL